MRRFREARERFDLRPLVIHTNYLINLASFDRAIRVNSIHSFRGELERASAIGAEYLVMHPGNYRTCGARNAAVAFAAGLKDAMEGLKLPGLTILLENTVGGGAQLGGKFAQLRKIRDLAQRVSDVPIGYCLDTCHLLAAGFDIATESGLEKTLAAADRELGLSKVKVIHANDSKGALGSRLDRHANIGEGSIGAEAFRQILRHPSLRRKPFILETPVDEDGDDRRNIEMLKRLAGQKIRSRPADD